MLSDGVGFLSGETSLLLSSVLRIYTHRWILAFAYSYGIQSYSRVIFMTFISTWNSNMNGIWFPGSASRPLIACARTRGWRTASYSASPQVCTVCCIPDSKNNSWPKTAQVSYSAHPAEACAVSVPRGVCPSACRLHCCSAAVTELAQRASFASSVNNGKNLEAEPNNW